MAADEHEARIVTGVVCGRGHYLIDRTADTASTGVQSFNTD
jgi:hypothetical protein